MKKLIALCAAVVALSATAQEFEWRDCERLTVPVKDTQLKHIGTSQIEFCPRWANPYQDLACRHPNGDMREMQCNPVTYGLRHEQGQTLRACGFVQLSRRSIDFICHGELVKPAR